MSQNAKQKKVRYPDSAENSTAQPWFHEASLMFPETLRVLQFEWGARHGLGLGAFRSDPPEQSPVLQSVAALVSIQ